MIQFEHVRKSYGKTPILKDLNFTIPDGPVSYTHLTLPTIQSV